MDISVRRVPPSNINFEWNNIEKHKTIIRSRQVKSTSQSVNPEKKFKYSKKKSIQYKKKIQLHESKKNSFKLDLTGKKET